MGARRYGISLYIYVKVDLYIINVCVRVRVCISIYR